MKLFEASVLFAVFNYVAGFQTKYDNITVEPSARQLLDFSLKHRVSKFF